MTLSKAKSIEGELNKLANYGESGDKAEVCSYMDGSFSVELHAGRGWLGCLDIYLGVCRSHGAKACVVVKDNKPVMHIFSN